MSLVKNLRRKEIEIFGAKRIIRNAEKEQSKEIKESSSADKKNNQKRLKKVGR